MPRTTGLPRPCPPIPTASAGSASSDGGAPGSARAASLAQYGCGMDAAYEAPPAQHGPPAAADGRLTCSVRRAHDGFELGPEAQCLRRLRRRAPAAPRAKWRIFPTWAVPVRYAREPGRRPTVDEDPVNAFIRVLRDPRCRQSARSRGWPDRGEGLRRRRGHADDERLAHALVHPRPSTPSSSSACSTRAGTIVGKTNLDDFPGSGLRRHERLRPAPQPAPAVPTPAGGSSGRLCRRRRCRARRPGDRRGFRRQHENAGGAVRPRRPEGDARARALRSASTTSTTRLTASARSRRRSPTPRCSCR